MVGRVVDWSALPAQRRWISTSEGLIERLAVVGLLA
jgi:hypothetical protein